MAKWLKDYLNFGSRRDAPQPPRPDYKESEILRAYRVQKELDFEDPYKISDKPQHGYYSGCSGTVSLPAFPAFASVLPDGVEVKVVSPKHRLIKVDSQEFSHSKIPLSPVNILQEPVLPSAPAAVEDLDTDYSDPFDARPVPQLRVSWKPNCSQDVALSLIPISSPTLVAFSPNPTPGHSHSPGNISSYMEPFEAQRVITEIHQGPERDRPGVGNGRSGFGGQLYDNPYEERTSHYHKGVQSSQQGRESYTDETEVRDSRLPQNDERPADEYDQPWEWKKDGISKALAVTFEGAEWERSLAQSDQARLARVSPTAPGSAASLRRPGDTPSILGERVDPCLPLERQVWYHGAVSRTEAETLLTLCKESSYLVRKSQTCPNDYSLSLRSCHGFMHMKFTQCSDGRYVLGENSPPFSTIPEVIHFYTTHKLPIRGAEHLSLLYPVIVQTL
ncbi:hypothetical protein DPEC_G00151430 [Dallia pectoralis]|uniref:Uncharacterized protein n=1 Tax=Dallia pectoralis TaxID=75939 RepID=A0ACC2GJ12_DALPE|nr:hypothetical protein DPEC_G00151430 [Dallia pectoralis]